LSEQLREFAQQHPQVWLSEATCVLRRTGVAANHKHVHRLYREAGLSLRRKKRKRLNATEVRDSANHGENEEWAVDFATDSLTSQRHL
jgi:putative transposase